MEKVVSEESSMPLISVRNFHFLKEIYQSLIYKILYDQWSSNYNILSILKTYLIDYILYNLTTSLIEGDTWQHNVSRT